MAGFILILDISRNNEKNDDDGWAAPFAEFINHGSMLGQHNHILTVKDDNEFAAIDEGVLVSLLHKP